MSLRFDFHLAFQEYLAMPGFSFHGMKEFNVSPLQYWHTHLNPNAPAREQTDAQRFGGGFHCATLEPKRWSIEYGRSINPAENPGALDTIKEIRDWYERETGTKAKGSLKREVIDAALKVDANVKILDVIEAQHALRNEGRIMLKWHEYDHIERCARHVLAEPLVERLLAGTRKEVSVMRGHPETGMLMKSRFDAYVDPIGSGTKAHRIVDLKKFSLTRQVPIDQFINNEIWYRGYYQQAVFYAMMLGWPEEQVEFYFVFVQSEPPYEVRVRKIAPDADRITNGYWAMAVGDISRAIGKYAHYVKNYGIEKPWREEQAATVLIDDDMKGFAFS